MTAFEIELNQTADGPDILRVGFGEPATGEAIVMDIARKLDEMDLTGGRIILIDGRLSVAGAMTLAHHLSHLYGAIAMFDPKLGRYIVTISHSPDFRIGSLIDR